MRLAVIRMSFVLATMFVPIKSEIAAGRVKASMTSDIAALTSLIFMMMIMVVVVVMMMMMTVINMI